MTLKYGALSTPDMEFIRANVNKISVEDIAAHLNRRPISISKYINTNRLGSTTKEGEKNQEQILKELKAHPFYKSLPKILTFDEIQMFTEHWISVVDQFSGDILASEILELRELILFEVLKDRTLKDDLYCQQERACIMGVLSSAGDDLDKDEKRTMKANIAQLSAQSDAAIRQFKDLSDKQQKVKQGLYKKRSDRTSDLDKTKVDFTALLKMLQDFDYRKKVAKEMELVKEAKSKEYDNMGGYHTYANKQIDQVVLNSDTVRRVSGDKGQNL